MDSRPFHRHPLRLAGYDYSQPGYYFVTICTHDRACTLGQIEDTGLHPSLEGRIVEQSWQWLQSRHPYVTLDVFAIMPNHLHGILVLDSENPSTSPRRPLGRLLAAFKTVSAHRINSAHGTPGQPVWQRGYHEHIVRNEAALVRIRDYIACNPLRWVLDPQNPRNEVPNARRHGTPDDLPWMV